MMKMTMMIRTMVTDGERNDEKNYVQKVKEDEKLCHKKEEEADEGIDIENETVDYHDEEESP